MDNLLIPLHIGFIMDGNGRWAKQRGLSRSNGHREGVRAMQRIIEASAAKGIKYISLFAFSTENWSRPQEEIQNLLDYVRQFLKRQAQDYLKQGYVIKFIGNLDELPDDIASGCKELHAASVGNDGTVVCVYLNYGGRNDIVNACNALLKSGLSEVGEKEFESALFTAGIPCPDLVVRTGGEIRISNFMLYQLAYSELMFTDCYWPDYDEKRLEETLAEYASRTRKFGG